MEEKEIEKKVIQIIAGIFKKNLSEISRETRFVENLQPKSMDTIALIAALSGEFKIKILPAEVQENKTVGEAIDWIVKKLKEKE
ncbi:MAG: acyl carrier protein [Candidatus Nealsonbacteria bacterium CG08_land_8_20_14_0_20_38_20]|uniref:Acyl carrier protein n=1 Tax=Candidatus Nealsonbacteria bacterium CG08_land_8_20_14_0_20_38_20 TaxID=1974705 RepID=A0A2H0YKY3_9BACT|nr:MAG: acyl carrier protein [Candidatus Nealsonbacteria bacterium CG08_land_8_20_14_0_20_38_20]